MHVHFFSIILPSLLHRKIMISLSKAWLKTGDMTTEDQLQHVFVYKSLLHWHSFEAEKTNIFDRIIHTIRSSVEVVISINKYTVFLMQWHKKVGKQVVEKLTSCIHVQNAESSGELAYWLSTTSTLLYLLQNTLKASSSSTKVPNRSRTATGNLFNRMVQVSFPSRLLLCINRSSWLRCQIHLVPLICDHIIKY